MRPEDACNRQDWGGNQNPIWIGSKWFNGLGLPQFNFQKYKTEELTLMKYMSTNSQRTVVMPSRARPLPTLRTVFFRENFLASPSTVMMNFIPYAWHNNQSCQQHFVKLHHDRTMLKAPIGLTSAFTFLNLIINILNTQRSRNLACPQRSSLKSKKLIRTFYKDWQY